MGKAGCNDPELLKQVEEVAIEIQKSGKVAIVEEISAINEKDGDSNDSDSKEEMETE